MHKAYFIFNSELKLPASKLAVQVGHGTDLIWQHSKVDEGSFLLWLDKENGDRRKIILKVKSSGQLNNMKKHLESEGFYCFEIIDSGYNVINSGTVTGLVIFPTNQESKKINRLRLY